MNYRIAFFLVGSLILILSIASFLTWGEIKKLDQVKDTLNNIPVLEKVITCSPKKFDGNKPVIVALQVGHYKTEQMPEELKKLRTSTGAHFEELLEWQVNDLIVQEIVTRLKERNITVEVLPAVVPLEYNADLFISIHADEHIDKNKRGFKIANRWNDQSGLGDELVNVLEKNYHRITGIPKDSYITLNMTNFYAFNWRKYEHSINPCMIGVLVETGFLSNAEDRKVIVDNPALPAQAIAEGLVEFLKINQQSQPFDK